MSINKNIFADIFSLHPRISSFVVWAIGLFLAGVGFTIDQLLGATPADYREGYFFSDMTPGRVFVMIGAIIFITPFAVATFRFIIRGIIKIFKNGNIEKT